MTQLTTEPPQLLFDYRSLPAEHQQFVMQKAVEIKFYMHMTLSAVDTAGGYLIEVKKRLDHGLFMRWCDEELGLKRQTAQNWMNVHEKIPTDGNLENLSLGAAYVLAQDSTPDAIRTAAYEAVNNGEHVTRKIVQGMIAAAKPSKGGGSSAGSSGSSSRPTSANDDEATDRLGFHAAVKALLSNMTAADRVIAGSIGGSRERAACKADIRRAVEKLDNIEAELDDLDGREAA